MRNWRDMDRAEVEASSLLTKAIVRCSSGNSAKGDLPATEDAGNVLSRAVGAMVANSSVPARAHCTPRQQPRPQPDQRTP